MNPAKDIEPVTTLKTRTAELIRRTTETGEPILITQNGRATAVLQDIETWQRQRETLLLLKAVVQGDQDYRAGRKYTNAQAREVLEAHVEELRGNG